METFCETVQFYLKHLEDSVYPVMTEDQFALKLFPMYRYFVTVWLRNPNPEVRRALLRGPPSPEARSSPARGASRAEMPLRPALFPDDQRGQSRELVMLSVPGPCHLRRPAWRRPRAPLGRAVIPACRCPPLSGRFTYGSYFHVSNVL